MSFLKGIARKIPAIRKKIAEAAKKPATNSSPGKKFTGAVSEAAKKVAAGKAETAPATEYVRIGRFGRIPKSFLTPKPKQTTAGAIGSAMTGKSSAAKDKEDEIRGKAKSFASKLKRFSFAEGGAVRNKPRSIMMDFKKRASDKGAMDRATGRRLFGGAASAPAPTRTPRPDNNPKFDGVQKLKDAGLFEQRMAKFKADQQERRAQMKKNSTGKKLSDIVKNKQPTKILHGVKPKAFQKGGAVYEVNGQRVTKEQYEEAAKKMDKPRSKAEEDLFDFANKAKARNKLTPINKAKGGVAKKPPGLYANIHAKKKRIAAGSGEKMRKVGSKGAPTKAAFIKSAKTARKG